MKALEVNFNTLNLNKIAWRIPNKLTYMKIQR